MIVQLLEVLVGLALVYLVFSTIASALVEAIEMALQRRGKYLEQGIGEILTAVAGTRQISDLREFYGSPFISSLFRDSYQDGNGKLPAYIPPERFTDAVLHLAREGKDTFAKFIKRMEEVIGPAAAADVEAIRAQCIRYFNESMQRVSSWYQRYARWWLLAIGFLIASIGNIDTLQLMRTLSQDDALREQVVEEATRRTASTPTGSIGEQRIQLEEQLKLVDSLGLPIGWTQAEVCTVFQWFCPEDLEEDAEPPPGSFDFIAHGAFWSKLLGVWLTAFALTFSAPFWFDVLNQVVNLRSALKPKATTSDEATLAQATKPSTA